MTRFAGAVYDPAQDDRRLERQMGRVWALMVDQNWRTLGEIAKATGDPEASVSCQLRHLRKVRFGSYRVEKRPRGDRKAGLFEYRVLPPIGAKPCPSAEVRIQFRAGQGEFADFIQEEARCHE